MSICHATRIYLCPPKTTFQHPSKHTPKHAALAALKKKQAEYIFWEYIGSPVVFVLLVVLYFHLDGIMEWYGGLTGEFAERRPAVDDKLKVNAFKVPDINAFGSHGYTKLMLACSRGQYSEVQRILAVPGMDVNLRSKTLQVPVLYSAASRNYFKIVRLLLAVPNIDVNLPNGENGATVLHLAAGQGHLRIVVDLLLRATDTIDVNRPTRQPTRLTATSPAWGAIGTTPVMMACQGNRYYVVEWLLHSKQLDLYISSNDGNTDFFSACRSGNVKLVKLLLNYMKWISNNNKGGEKGKIDEKWLNAHSMGYTPFFVAVQNGNPDLVKLLLNVPGVDINKGRPQAGVARWSPLDNARHGAGQGSQKHADVVELLLAAGAIDYKNMKAPVAKQRTRRRKKKREGTQDWLDTEQFRSRWKLIEAHSVEQLIRRGAVFVD